MAITTNLYCSSQVVKDDIRCEVCGTIDELTSFLGLAKSLLKEKPVKEFIELIQHNLFVLGAEVATKPKFIPQLKLRIGPSYINDLENRIKEFKKGISSRKPAFILPGEDFASSTLDVARTIARRLERRAVTLKRKHKLRNECILDYLNHLSNVLYSLARYVEKEPNYL